MSKTAKTINRKQARASKTKARIKFYAGRPRLVVGRSNKFIYAQLINEKGQVIGSAASTKLQAKNKIEAAKLVGELVAKAALAQKVSQVVFDRKHYKYHGQIKALAQSAREHGLKF